MREDLEFLECQVKSELLQVNEGENHRNEAPPLSSIQQVVPMEINNY